MTSALLERVRQWWDGLKTRAWGRQPRLVPEPVDRPSGSPATSEQAVLSYLSDCDGWAWQGNVQEGLDWSPAKTSDVLSGMERDGQVVRHRVGRAKVVCLPERDPAKVMDPTRRHD